MTTIPLTELIPTLTPLPWNNRHHESIETGGETRTTPVIASDMTGGDWLPVAYVNQDRDAAYLAHAANHLPKCVAILPLLEELQWDDEGYCRHCTGHSLGIGGHFHTKGCAVGSAVAALRNASIVPIP